MIFNAQGQTKQDLIRWMLQVRTLAAEYAPKETGTLLNIIMTSAFKLKTTSKGFEIEISIDLPYAEAQHDEALRHLPNFQSSSPRMKMANLSKIPTKFKKVSPREPQTHKRRYSRGYYRARQQNKLEGPMKNPYLDRAIEESKESFDNIIDGLITKMIKKYLD
jgi:hypothetical protein